MKSFVAKKEDISRDWYVVDATDQVLGRLASEVARRLRGKHKAIFTPHVDTGDFIVVVNAEKVALTGRKMEQKMYHRHSGYPGGITSINARRMLDTHPERVLIAAVKGMLPKNRLGRQMLKKLKVYVGPEHPHQAQQPQTLSLS
ncbi:MAG: 50S ribosomal protein L13 [Desulfarculaceae bacterium]|nr:50S ribosomal protein L13 [Desulfarculaceae bacterium]MCF8070967.1 50S ribosomal protein L13 [Desulfarculaceae bacterium]MCF8100555.1 50S ribosomal protein L13 [Desulfarculaceae bacterium]MCF8116581.1 50S ribosomal protein L13 [Desulfarculaceae bacterium]